MIKELEFDFELEFSHTPNNLNSLTDSSESEIEEMAQESGAIIHKIIRKFCLERTPSDKITLTIISNYLK